MKSTYFLLMWVAALLLVHCSDDKVQKAERQKQTVDSVRLARFIKDSTDAATAKAIEEAKAAKQNLIDSVIAANGYHNKSIDRTPKQNKITDQISPADIQIDIYSGVTVMPLVGLIKKKVKPIPYLTNARKYSYRGLEYSEGNSGPISLVIKTPNNKWLYDSRADGFNGKLDSYKEKFYTEMSEDEIATANLFYYKEIQSYKKLLDALPDAN